MPTALPLVNDILARYNNLPAIPPNDPLGDIINQLFAAASGGALNRLLTVSASGAQYTTIEDALAAAVALIPTTTDPVVILVGPGTYSENNPLQVPTGVFLETYEASGIGAVTIDAQNAGSPVIEVTGTRCGIAGFRIQGATTSIGVRMSGPTAQAQLFMARCLVLNCLTGVSHEAGIGVYIQNQIIGAFGTMTRAVSVTGDDFLSVTGQIGGVQGTPINEGLVVDGATAQARIIATTFLDSVTSCFAKNGSTMRLGASSCLRCNNAVRVEDSTLEADGLGVIDHVNAATDLFVSGSTSRVFWTGGQLNADRLDLDNSALLAIAAPMFRAGGVDPSFSVIGELSVGTDMVPRESAFGEGDSHQRGLSVLTNTNDEAGTWADITADFEDSATSTNLFPGVAANNAWYMGGDSPFSNFKLNMTAAMVLGAGSIAIQFWNGASWQTLPIMATQADTTYEAYGNAPFERASQNEQYRYNPETLSTWATKTLNGVTKYWIRAFVTVGITTSPSASFVKIGTNRSEINADGFQEFFGQAIQARDLLVHQRLSDDLSGASPGNGALNLTSNITITPIDNQYNDGVLDGVGQVMHVVRGLDTSRPITFEVMYAPQNNNTGDVELEMNYAVLKEGDVIDGSVADANIPVVDTVPINTNDVMRKVQFDLDVSSGVPSNFVAMSVFRDATAGNADDTYVGNIRIVYIRAFGYFWI